MQIAAPTDRAAVQPITGDFEIILVDDRSCDDSWRYRMRPGLARKQSIHVPGRIAP
jgi:hypothetical protein